MILAIVAAVILVIGIAAGALVLGIRLLGAGANKTPANEVRPGSDQTQQEEQRFSGWQVSVMRAYDKDGTLYRTEEYSYDLLGRLIKEQCYDREGIPYQYDVYVYDLNGGYTVTTYVNESGRAYIVEEYDAAGNRLLRIIYEEDGSESVRYEQEYDARGNLLRKYAMEKSKDFEGSTEYAYDENDNRILYVIYEKGVELERFVYTYDEQGRMLREERIPNPETDPYSDKEIFNYTYNPDGTVRREHIFRNEYYRHEIFRYDDAGRETLYLRFFNEGELGTARETVYDDEGRILCEKEIEGYDTFPNFVYGQSRFTYGKVYTYAYNDRGDQTLKEYSYYGKLMSREETTYHGDGRPDYTRVVNADGKLSSETFFIYDDRGNLLFERHTNENRETGDPGEIYQCYEYTYDINGNMTSEAYYYNRETRQYYYEYDYIYIP